MSQVQRQMDEQNEKHAAAVDLLKRVGYLETCENHDEITFTVGGDENVTEAYKLGNTQWESSLKTVFKDRREMTDRVKAVSEDSDYANDGCEICRGHMSGD